MAADNIPDYWDLCRWKTMNVQVSDNVFSFNPATIDGLLASGSPQCTAANLCGYNGLYAMRSLPCAALLTATRTGCSAKAAMTSSRRQLHFHPDRRQHNRRHFLPVKSELDWQQRHRQLPGWVLPGTDRSPR